MINKISLLRKPQAISIALLALSLLSFGWLIPQLGFYWDDWPSLIIYKLQGLEGFKAFFASDRPTTYLSYYLLMPIFGYHPVAWQVFDVVLRWLVALCLWCLLRNLWPGAEWISILASLLFVVYPVFHQQAIALTYHQLWMEYVFFMLSLLGMVLAIRQPRRYWLWTFVGVAGLALNFLISEYFIGVELLRPVILWIALSPARDASKKGERLKNTLWLWLPYLLTFLIYLIWRFVLLKLPGEDRNATVIITELLQNPVRTLPSLIQMALQDVSHVLVTNWYSTFQPAIFEISSPSSLASLGITGLVGLLTAGFLFMLKMPDPPKSEQPQRVGIAAQALLLGLVLTVSAPLPAWATGRQIIVGAWSDRLAVPAMLGASLALAGAVTWIVRSRAQQIVIISLLVGLAAGYHFQNANDYRWARISQNRFYWQLYWRAPAVEPQTAFLGYAEVLPKTGLYSTASGINFIYAGDTKTESSLPYWFFSLSREYGGRMAELSGGTILNAKFRQFHYQSSASNSLYIYYDPGEADCLRLATPEDKKDPALPELSVQALPLINLARIKTTGSPVDPPSAQIFGPEPEHNWCFFFEKADLARQMKDWQQVVKLGDEARAKGYGLDKSESNTPQEWLPFIEGYAYTGQWQAAGQLTSTLFERWPKMKGRLCDLWQGIRAQSPAGGESSATTILANLSCAQ